VESWNLGVVAVMLLNEFLKEHRKVQELEATVVQQKKDMQVFAANLKEQTSQIKKMSAELEVSKSRRNSSVAKNRAAMMERSLYQPPNPKSGG
jgi:uncharacterized coiled-coil protein SlyX